MGLKIGRNKLTFLENFNMVETRKHGLQVYNNLATLTKRLINSVGKMDIAAEETRVSKTMLSQYGDRNHPTKMMPVDVVLDLEDVAGEPILSRFLVERQGYVLVALTSAHDRNVTLADQAHLVKEFGEVLAATSEAIANDGRICAEEIARGNILQEYQDMIDALVGQKHRLQQILEAG